MTEQEKEILEEEAASESSEDSATDSGAPDGEACKTDSGAPDGEACKTDSGAADGEESDSEEEAVSEGDGKMSWAEKRAAKKQSKADKQTEAYKEQIAQLEDKVMRQLAEFENFRNRTNKEKQQMFETGAKSVIEKILPVVDNFERGLAVVPEDKKDDPFVDGMSRIYKQLVTELENIGVKPIEAVGQEFDPNLHNAVMQVASEEYESGVVAQELLKGYTYRDSVVRHSMVAVVE